MRYKYLSTYFKVEPRDKIASMHTLNKVLGAYQKQKQGIPGFFQNLFQVKDYAILRFIPLVSMNHESEKERKEKYDKRGKVIDEAEQFLREKGFATKQFNLESMLGIIKISR